MSLNSASLILWSYGLAGLLYLAFAAVLAVKRDRGLREWILLGTIVCSAIWGMSMAGSVLLRAPALASVSVVLNLLAYGGWFAFLLSWITRPVEAVGETKTSRRNSWLVPIAIAVIAWGLAAHALALFGITALGNPGRIAVFDALAAAVLGLVLVEQVSRNTAEESRWSMRPLCTGLAAIFGFDIYTFADGVLFGRVDSDVFSVRGFVHALALPLIMLSITRLRGSKFRIVLSRQVMFRSTALALSGIYLLFIAGAGYYVRYFGGEWGRALQVALLFAGLLLFGVLLFSGSIRAKFRVMISKHFFSYRYDYREEWLRFTQSLSGLDAHAVVGQQVIKGLADMVESPGGGLWLRDAAGRSFVPAARWNMLANHDVENAVDGVAEFMAATGWVINLEELRSSPDRYAGLSLPHWLSAIENAWLIIPLTIGSQLTGFVVLVTARTPIEVNWEVNDLLKTAARQAASFLGQVQATEALLEARKFEAFNRMSAFVVHDLKNIVAQLSLMLRNAERHRANPEFQQDMLMTVEHSVERMKQLMLQLRDGTTPLDSTHRVELADIALRVQRAKATQLPAPELDIDERVAAQGHEDRLERVIGHLVQNAIDATGSQGRVWIKIGREGQQAMVEVGDTGHGMTAEFVRERLFKPFQTTKQTGMGIGAYESHQYVHELGGRVLVDSTPDVGTRMRLLLPISAAHEGMVGAPQRNAA